MIACSFCGQRMTSAPEHIEHAEACFKAKLGAAIDETVLASGGDPDRRSVKAKAARAEIERLVDLAARGGMR